MAPLETPLPSARRKNVMVRSDDLAPGSVIAVIEAGDDGRVRVRMGRVAHVAQRYVTLQDGSQFTRRAGSPLVPPADSEDADGAER
jgi:hypothetical protein